MKMQAGHNETIYPELTSWSRHSRIVIFTVGLSYLVFFLFKKGKVGNVTSLS